MQQMTRIPALAALLLMLLMVGTLGNVQGQTIQSVNPTSTTAGQSITMIITGTNTNFTTVTGVWLRHSTQSATVYQGSNFNATTATNSTVNFTIPPNAPLGNYHLQTYGGFPSYTNALNVGVGPGSNYGLVSGKVIFDNNANCVEDLGDSPHVGGIVTLMPGPIYITTGAQGDYSAWVPLGNYTISTNITGCGNYTCPVSGTHTANVPVSLSTDTGNDFYYDQPAVCGDLFTSINSQILRPGFDRFIYVYVGNQGPDGVTNAVASATLDPGVTYMSSSLAPSSIVGNTLTWNFASMPAGFNQMISVLVNVPVNTPLGTQMTFSSSIPAIGLDQVPNNNSQTRTFTVTGSSDPNDKRVWDMNGAIAEGPIDPSTTTLSYMIRFQNTGTDTAFNIFVRDTLSQHLNAGTLRVTGASHPYQFTLSGANLVQFTFPNILLADSFTNEPLSHGFISYSVDLNPGVPLGSTISNRASNYFDFNAGVLTNYTHSTLCALLNPGYSATGTGLSYTFTDLSAPTPTSWAWDFGDGATSTSQNPTHTYAAMGTYVVCLTASNGCRSESFCDTIVICQPPTSSFNSSILGATVTFTDQSSANITTWAWDFGDGGVSASQNPSHTYAVGGAYNVCLTVTDACSTATSCSIVDLCVPTNESISYIAGPVLDVDFTGTADPSVNVWNWTFGDGGTSTLQNPTHTYATSGSYQVCLQVANGCSTSTTCTNLTLVGIDEGLAGQFSIFPNPSSGVFMLQADLPASGELGMQVYDAKGMLISDRHYEAAAGPLQAAIDLSGHPAGLYFLRLEHGGQSTALRLQKL
jgi:PKD repeat protein